VVRIRFFNSIGGSAFWSGVIEELRELGFDVSDCEVTKVDDYRKPSGTFGRLKNIFGTYVWYPLKVFALPGNANTFVACTNPFFLPTLLRLRLGSKSRTIMLVYDLFPDALELSGMVRPSSSISWLIGHVTRYAIRHSCATVFLGENLKRFAELRYGTAKRSALIHVGADSRPFVGSPPKRLAQDAKIQIAYSGNLGRAHDAETLLAFFAQTVPSNYDWRFQAFGKKYASLKQILSQSSNSDAFVLGSPLVEQDWVEFMRQSHIALVTLAAGWENVVMPSKAYSALVAGQAILAICPDSCDLANIIRKHDCGWVVPVGDTERLRHILTTEACDPEILYQKRLNAFDAGHAVYSSRAVAIKWKQLFEQLDSEIPR
jgi:colanic acid biosynthesis glycosyl transferase WcaI